MVKLFLFRLGVPLAGRAPWLFYRLAVVVGWLAWRVQPGRRRRVINNLLPLCDGDERRARRQGIEVFRHVARYYVDLATLPRRDIACFERDHLRLVHGERLKLLDAPGPLIVLSAHTGNPELAVQGFTNRGRAFVALVEPLQPRSLADYLLALRSSAGGAFYEADRRGVRACLDALRDGKLVAIIADRDIQGTGVCVDLCGRKVKLPRGPFELARRTHASLLPILAAREGVEDQVVFVEEPYCVPSTGDAEEDVRMAAQHWACILGRHLLRYPGQWKVLEEYWAVHACGES